MLISPERKFLDMVIIARGSAKRCMFSRAHAQPTNTSVLTPITVKITARASKRLQKRSSMRAVNDASHDGPGRRRGSPPEPPLPPELGEGRRKSGEGWLRDRSDERDGLLSDRNRGMRDHTHAAMPSPAGAACRGTLGCDVQNDRKSPDDRPPAAVARCRVLNPALATVDMPRNLVWCVGAGNWLISKRSVDEQAAPWSG
ncbi:hypothetical protein L1887_61832 [Cichorium endivia]|nr:hypothetical protein L1887_61832 [Cichorium endivia]